MIPKRSVVKIGALLCAAMTLSACGGASTPSASEGSTTPSNGGELVVASLPSMIDPYVTTSRSNWMVAASVCEGLFANAANTEVGEGLASGYEYDEKSGVYTVKIREGIKLHNGAGLDSGDVVASLERYSNADAGKLFKSLTKDVTAIDPLTISISTVKPTGAIPALLATPDTGAYIMSKASLEAAGDNDLTALDCTGPYKLDSFQTDQQAVISRFDDYATRDEKADGALGAKTAYADTIKFIPFNDANALNQVRTGQAHVVPQFLSMDQLSVYQADPSLKPVVSEGAGFSILQLNNKSGLMQDLKMRQAVLNAVDPTAIAMQQLGGTEYFADDSSLFPKGSPWYSEAGSEIYKDRDIERGKSLLKEAGYDGTPIRVLYRPDSDGYGPLLKQQLEGVGLAVDVQAMDAATFGSTRTDASKWDIFLAGGTAYSDPLTVVFLNDDFPGWWDSPEKQKLMAAVTAGKNVESRLPAWNDMQKLIWEELPFVKLGHEPRLSVVGANVGGFEPTQGTVRGFYNVWLGQ